MITKEIRQQILDFCKIAPRSISEIALHIRKNWRTADRYVEQVAQDTGLIAIKVFRAGSQGALKAAYWNHIEAIKGNAYQEALFNQIISAKRKDHFSPMDIYQFTDAKKRRTVARDVEFSKEDLTDFAKVINSAQEQLFFFSGNVSWIRENKEFEKIIRKKASQGVKIKFLTRVDLTSIKETNELLAINRSIGSDMIEIRHCDQPLRAVIVDDTLISIKEVIEPNGREIKKKSFLIYRISDRDWILWLQKVFWHMWAQSLDAQQRLTVLDEIKK